MAETVKRVTVTLPREQVEQIKQFMAADPVAYPTVSAFVRHTIADRLADLDAHEMLLKLLRETGGEPTEEDRAWAAEALALADQMALKGGRDHRGAA